MGTSRAQNLNLMIPVAGDVLPCTQVPPHSGLMDFISLNAELHLTATWNGSSDTGLAFGSTRTPAAPLLGLG